MLSIYDPARPEDLVSVMNGSLKKARPSFVLTFDDGFESHGTYIAEYLKQKNIKGWFFVPTEAPQIPEKEQHQWAIDHNVIRENESVEVNGRIFASWGTWKKCAEYHEIGSHTHTHLRFKPEINSSEVQSQLSRSYQKLQEIFREDNLNKVFCWVGGEQSSYSTHAATVIREMGTDLAFTTCSMPVHRKTNPLRIERTNIESHFPLHRLKMAAAGGVDIRYVVKRRKLDACFD